MFYTTDEGTSVIELGSGDTEIAGSHLEDEPEIGAISFIKLIVPVQPGTQIDRTQEKEAGWTDEDLGVHTRIIFTDIRSIDVLIEQAMIARDLMIKHKTAATPGETAKIIEECCKCQKCGNRYRVDIIVPDDLWEKIKPAGKDVGAGLMCGSCILQAIEDFGDYDKFELVE